MLAPSIRGQKGSEAARTGDVAGMRGERKAGLETQAGKPGLMEEVLCEWTFTANTQSCLRGREAEVAPGRVDPLCLQLKEAVRVETRSPFALRRPPTAEALTRGGQAGENDNLFT